jgi:hypothetical protein
MSALFIKIQTAAAFDEVGRHHFTPKKRKISMGKSRKNNRTVSIVFFWGIFFLFFLMNCTHDASIGKIVSIRGNHIKQNHFNARDYLSPSGNTPHPRSIPVKELAPDGKPFFIYGLGFLCFLGWGWIRRKKASSINKIHIINQFISNSV